MDVSLTDNGALPPSPDKNRNAISSPFVVANPHARLNAITLVQPNQKKKPRESVSDPTERTEEEQVRKLQHARSAIDLT